MQGMAKIGSLGDGEFAAALRGEFGSGGDVCVACGDVEGASDDVRRGGEAARATAVSAALAAVAQQHGRGEGPIGSSVGRDGRVLMRNAYRSSILATRRTETGR